jgi:hypothetical protein
MTRSNLHIESMLDRRDALITSAAPLRLLLSISKYLPYPTRLFFALLGVVVVMLLAVM